jgi:hypothetical protein
MARSRARRRNNAGIRGRDVDGLLGKGGTNLDDGGERSATIRSRRSGK